MDVIISYYIYFGVVNAFFFIYILIILSLTGSLMVDLADHKTGIEFLLCERKMITFIFNNSSHFSFP